MKIFNIRKGLATNSSSLHSFLQLSLAKQKKLNVKDDDVYDGNFGWSFFTVQSKESKEEYVNCLLRNAIYEAERNVLIKKLEQEGKDYDFNIHDDLISEKVNDVLKNDFKINDIQNTYIDHQSVLNFPLEKDGKSVNKDFFNDFKNYILRDDIVILGGNDNDEKEHHLLKEGNLVLNDLMRDGDSTSLEARKDNDYWVIFNKKDGSKVRFSFEDINEPTKATYPELVDVKITNFCPYSCEFCYQDSNKKGIHSDLDFIKSLAIEFENKKVFEVALGGGETTLHPNFLEILNIFKEHHIVPNFTTRNYGLFKHKDFEEIFKTVGALAFSITTLKDVDNILINRSHLRDFISDNDFDHKVKAQYVMGSSSIEDFEELLKTLNDFKIPVVLLGYKENGRGKDFESHEYDSWLKIVNKLHKKGQIYQVSIDTALAKESEEELDKLKIPRYTFSTKEGAFSMYVDAVNKTLSPSSYVGLEQTVPFDENWVANYASMQAEAEVRKQKRIINIVKK